MNTTRPSPRLLSLSEWAHDLIDRCYEAAIPHQTAWQAVGTIIGHRPGTPLEKAERAKATLKEIWTQQDEYLYGYHILRGD